jgi:transposase-like protein
MEKGKEKRIFSLEVKLELVKKIEQGDLRVMDVCRTYGVSNTAVYKWLIKYSDLYKKETRVIVEHKSISKKNKELQEQIKNLEQALGQKQMRIDYLEKVVDFASERSGEDIEKKNKRLS